MQTKVFFSHLSEGLVANFPDAARSRAGLREHQVAVCPAKGFTRQAAVSHKLEELAAIHLHAGLRHQT